MTDFVVLGTDTNAGKTTFALLWLAAFSDDYEYWKPLETGDADSQRVRRLVPAVRIHPPLARFQPAVAPLLAARQAGKTVPPAAGIAAAKPVPGPGHHLLIETFGSPFSPLNETELQLAFLRLLSCPAILVSSSAVGAVGRTLQCLRALEVEGVGPTAVVLMGPPDPFALEQIQRHSRATPVCSLQPPANYDVDSIARASREQRAVLELASGEWRVASGETQYRVPSTQYSVRGVLSPLATRHSPLTTHHSPLTAPADLLARDAQFVWHPYTSLRDPDSPLVCVAAQDEFLWLADGRQVIDAISSWWTILHGHRHPVLMAALHEAAQAFDHVHFAGVTHAHAVELADLMLRTAPWQGGRAFFSDNGSTAVEVALKLAYQYWCHQGEPERTFFVGFEGGYHGDTFGAMAVGRDPVFFGTFEPLLFRAETVPLAAERLDDTLRRHKGEVAAVIVEPLVQGAGGMRMHTPALLRNLADVSRAHGVLLIADEVMTGGGRTGSLWAHQAAGIAPDLICAAKTLAGGVLPLAVTLVAPAVVAAWDSSDRRRTFFHGHSFTAHPLACAVAVANWKMLTEGREERDEGRETRGETLAPRLSSLASHFEAFWNQALAPLRCHPRVREVRTRGTIAAVELDVVGGYLAAAGRQLRQRCLEHNVLLRPLGSVLYAMPPFCTSDQSLERIAEAMKESVESLGPV